MAKSLPSASIADLLEQAGFPSEIDLCGDKWELEFGRTEDYLGEQRAPLWTDENGTLSVKEHPSEAKTYFVELLGMLSATISFSRQLISFSAQPDIDEVTIKHLLADQIFPRVIAHSDSWVVHAGAVLMKQGAVLFIGPSGSGKSTLAASLRNFGLPLIGDDAIIIDLENLNGPSAKSVYSSLRLFPDSIEALAVDERNAIQMATYSQKMRIDCMADRSRHEAAYEIAGLVFLDDNKSATAVTLSLVSNKYACMNLIRNSFLLNPMDRISAARNLMRATSLACEVPAFLLSYPREYCGLPKVHDLLKTIFCNI